LDWSEGERRREKEEGNEVLRRVPDHKDMTMKIKQEEEEKYIRR